MSALNGRPVAFGVLAVLCCLGPAAAVEVPESLTFEKAIALALEHNPVVQAARSEIQIQEADVAERRLRLNPAFTTEVENYPYFSGNGGPYFQNSEITARFDYEIETRGRRKLRTEVAEQGVGVAEARYEDLRRRLRLQVQRAYFQVILERANVEVAESILEQTGRVIELNRVRLEQGDISELELRRIEVERLRFADDLFQAELALRNANAALLGLLNADDLGQNLNVAGALSVERQGGEPGLPPEGDVRMLSALARDLRPDLSAASRVEEQAETETRLQSAIRAPNVTVGGGYKRVGPDNSLVVGVTVPVRMFNRNQGGMLRAAAERRRAASLAAAVRNRVELEIQRAYNAVEVNRERVHYIEGEQLDKAQEARDVTLAAYRLGGGTLMDYLDSQRRFRDTVRIHNQALYDYRISLYELASAVGIGGAK